MAKVKFEEFKERLIEKLGDSDEDLSLLEDFTDSFAESESESGTTKEEYERRLKELDESWRKRYKERFSGKLKEKDEYLEEEKDGAGEEKKTFESLFEEKREDEK